MVESSESLNGCINNLHVMGGGSPVKHALKGLLTSTPYVQTRLRLSDSTTDRARTTIPIRIPTTRSVESNSASKTEWRDDDPILLCPPTRRGPLIHPTALAIPSSSTGHSHPAEPDATASTSCSVTYTFQQLLHRRSSRLRWTSRIRSSKARQL